MTSDPNSPIQIPPSFQFTPQRGDQAIPDYGASRTPNPYLQSGYSEPIGPAHIKVMQLRPGVWAWRYERYDGRGGFRQQTRDRDP